MAGFRVRSWRAALAIGTVATLALAACGSDKKSTSTTAAPSVGSGATGASTPAAAGGMSDKPLVIARSMDVNSLDPQRAYCDTCQIYMTAVYETLIGLDKDNKTLVPRLATTWTANADQTEFTFNLDPKAKFADGTPVTSADVKFSWERLQGLQGSALLPRQHDQDDRRQPDPRRRQGDAQRAELGVPGPGQRQLPGHRQQQGRRRPTAPRIDPDDRQGRAVVPRRTRPAAGRSCCESYTEGSELRLQARTTTYWGTKAAVPRGRHEADRRRRSPSASSSSRARSTSPCRSRPTSPRHGRQATSPFTKVPSFNFVYLALSPGAKGGEKLDAGRAQGDPAGARLRRPRRRHRRRRGQAAAVADPQRLRRHRRAAPRRRRTSPRPRSCWPGADVLVSTPRIPSFNVYGVDFTHGDAEGAVRPQGGRHQPQAEPGRDLRVGRQDRQGRHPRDDAVLRPRPHRLEPVRAVLRPAARLAVADVGEGAGRTRRRTTC